MSVLTKEEQQHFRDEAETLVGFEYLADNTVRGLKKQIEEGGDS